MTSRLTVCLLCAAMPLVACSGGSSETKSDETPTETSTETDDAATDTVADGSDEGSTDTTEEPAEAKPDLASADLESLFTVVGNADKDQIKGVIGQRKPDVFKCYQEELPNSPGLAGRVLAKITVTADGSVASALVTQSTLGNKPVETCMVTKMRDWKFPEDASGGLTMIQYPFVLPP